ncbi:unnamed protein product, partial [Mesorhabditis spiculigera]
MRYGWLLLSAAVVALAAREDSEAIKRVLSTWNDGPIVYADHWKTRQQEEAVQEPFENDDFIDINHGRSKRSIHPFLEAVLPNSNAAVLSSRFCERPGYTGEYCQYPICIETNQRVVDRPATDGDGAYIDAGFLGANCTRTHVTVVDDEMYDIIVTITSDGNIQPGFDLEDSTGKRYFANIVLERTPTTISAMYTTLPPNTYQLVPDVGVPNAACYFEIRAKTMLAVEGGFITGEDWQTERSDYPDLKYTYQYTLNTFVAHPSNMRHPGQLAVVSIMAGGNQASRSQPLRTRYGCGYEYYYESFFCQNLGEHIWLVEGVTWRGNPFRRMGVFSCLYNTNRPTLAPTGSTPAPTNPTSCANGGLLVTNPDGSAFCVCRGLWQGATCSQLVCMNGGQDRGGIACVCPNGFIGTHCQDVVCSDRGQDNFYVDKPSLVFVVRVRSQLQNVLDQALAAIQKVVNVIEAWDPEYVTNFGAVFYLDGKLIHAASYRGISSFSGAWNHYAANVTNNGGNCTDLEFSFIAQALQGLEISPRSKIYVITDSMPQDYGDNLETVFQLDSYFRVPIFFMYIEASPGQACTPDIHDPGFRAMDEIAQRTEGLAFYVTNRTSVSDLLYNHIWATFYRTQLLALDDLEVCSMQSLWKSISIDTTLDQLIIVARGTGLTLAISGEGVINPKLLYSGNDIYIWSADGIVAGNYFFNVLSSQALSSCSYRIFQRAYHQASFGNPQFEMFWKFSQNINFDGFWQQPVVGNPMSIGIHLTNFPDRIPPQYVQAELLITATRGGAPIDIYSSNGIWRDGCDYNFYFPPFTCRTGNENLHFQFFTRDALGFTIQRAGNMYCTEYHPTFAPPGGCQNGGVPDPMGNNQTCYCPPGYTGQFCEQLVCWNGGTPLGFGFCACPPGFMGTHCETLSCIEKGPPPQIMTQFVDMVFAIELTTTAYAQIVNLNKMFPEILRDTVSHHPEWIRNFVLIGFNSTWGGTIATANSFQPQNVVQALQNIASNYNQLDSSTDACNGTTVEAWHAMAQAIIQRNIRPGSYINLFIASAPEQSRNLPEIIEMYEAVLDYKVKITAVVAYNNVNGGSYLCNNTWNTFELIHDLCRYSNGESYNLQQAVVEGFVRTIPMKFMQGVVAHRRYDNCVGTQYISVPVDAYAQSLLIAVQGYQAQVELYNGYNRLQIAPNFRPLTNAQDSVSGWNFFTQRASCDPDWDPVGDYCMLFSYPSQDYATAQAICRNGGGMLADDLTADKHAYLVSHGAGLKFWFGLNNQNQTGWQWDRENGVPPVSWNASGINYWNGGSPPTDNTKLCGFFDSSSGTNNWNGDSCQVAKSFVCQKHLYDWNYQPNRIDDDDMPAGKYYVKVTTKQPPTDGSTTLGPGCFIDVRVQSHLQIYGGYTEDSHADFPDPSPVSQSTQNRLVTFVDSAASFQQRTPILTHGLIFSAHNETMWDAVTYQPRVLCSLDWISQPFTCPDADNADNLFAVYHMGEDEYGHTFQRIVNGHCQKPSITCGNGGLRYNGSCVCTEYWQGKQCSTPICVNGGYLDMTNTRCLCPDGFEGPACQYEACINPQNYTFDTSGSTLTVILEVTQNNKDNANNFVNGLNAALNTITSMRYKNYLLVTFNSNGVVFNQNFSSTTGLLASISSQINAISNTGSCNLPIFGAIGAAFQNPNLRYGGDILLVASSVPSDTDQRWSTILMLNGASPKIHYFYSATSTCFNGAEMPTTDDAWHLQRVAYATDGNNFFTNKDQIQKAITVYLPSIATLSNTLSHPTYFSNFTCETPTNWYLQIDNDSTDIYISVSNDVASISVVDPRGNQLPPDVLYSYGSQKYYHIHKNEAGTYLFTTSGPGACYVNIQAIGGPQAWAGFVQPTAADPTGAHTDQTSLTAVAGVKNVAVFHMYQLGQDRRSRGILNYFEMYDPVSMKAVYGELYRRDKCHFEYYSDPFDCTANEGFYMTIHGVDQVGQTFQRHVVAFCLPAGSTTAGPTTSPNTGTTPSTTTTTTVTTTTTAYTGTTMTTTPGIQTTTSDVLANRVVDIVFVIDSSATAQSKWADAINVAGSRDGEFPVAPLSSITSTDALFKALSDIQNYYNDFGATGQYTGQALELVSGQYTKPSDGYNPNTNNHWVIYLTSAASITDTDDAKRNANYLKSFKYYSIAGVSYGDGSMDRASLQLVTGGTQCSFVPSDQNALMTTIVMNLQNLIFDNDGTACMSTS